MHRRTVEELMTRDVVRALRDMPFKEIVKLLAENDVTAVPVVDELDRPLGVVSEADLLHKSSAQADPFGPTLVEAARLMAVQNVKRLPVVDETDRLRGIVSRGDLLRTFMRRDDAIRDEITQDVLRETLDFAGSEATVEVREGRVTLGGSVEVRNLIPSR